jgi:pimeloyl-ACP methyl ester carboxylesterase
MRKTGTWVALVVVLACGGGEPPPEPAAPPSPVGDIASGDGVPVRYAMQGDGPIALVFIHGWCCDRSHWSNQIDFFSRDHTVVTLDLPGHGESGMERPGWPLAAFGADVRAVIEGLGLERVVLVGHSMGGPVALDTARLIPERILGIVGVDTLHNAEWELDSEQAKQIVAEFEADFSGTCDGLVRDYFFLPDADPALVDRVASGMCDAPPEVALAIWKQFLDWDIPGAMSAVDLPLRCINGTGEETKVEVNRKYARDYEVLLIDGTGHVPMLERPDEFNRLLAEVVEELTGT